ncbi:MAG: YbjN domain-containing protein [Planctomycetaceae bacterium]|nr:YbjN domain-containing protein [Planctomycetaceae bacterium]
MVLSAFAGTPKISLEKQETKETAKKLSRPAALEKKVPMDGSDIITSVVEEFFAEEDWKFQEVKKGIYRSGVEGKQGSYRIYFFADDDTHILQIFTIIETNFAVQHRSLVSEFLTRANYGLKIGNFEMDFDDGSVQYRVSNDFEDGILNTKIVRRMLYVGIRMMDRYYPGMMEVVWGGKSAKEAIEHVENPIVEE